MNCHKLFFQLFVQATVVAFVCDSAVLLSQEKLDVFPYQAIVRNDETAVHSGPGKVHYVTCILTQGDTVEVYRHDPDGWCAIRPPKNSFSLIPATAIEELGNGVGEISEEGTQAWVGTQLGPVDKPLWQVKLRKGEQVQLLGIATWPDPEGFTTSWYQVAPPAGEFRWIRLDQLSIPAGVHAQLSERKQDRTKSVEGIVTSADYEGHPHDSSEIGLTSYQVQDRVRPPRDSERRFHNSNNNGWRQARTPIERGPANPFESLPNRDRPSPPASPERFASAPRDTRFDVGMTSGGLSAGSQTAPSSFGPLTPRMTELELKLNQEMIKEPNQWRLIDLQTSAEKIVSSASDSGEQVQAQRFLRKLEDCRQLRDQFIRGKGGQPNRELANSNNDPPTGGSTSPVNLDGKDVSLSTLYDAHGWLKEMAVDGGRTDPGYVLLDESGKVTHHVAPGPGMNLGVYVSKRIGIMGQRGYHTRYKLDHVTAHKVIELK